MKANQSETINYGNYFINHWLFMQDGKIRQAYRGLESNLEHVAFK